MAPIKSILAGYRVPLIQRSKAARNPYFRRTLLLILWSIPLAVAFYSNCAQGKRIRPVPRQPRTLRKLKSPT
jgi:hypothetical protein